METKIIKAVFGGSRYTVTAKRTRTDYGQVLEISGVDLPSTFECIFSNSATSAGVGKKMIGSAQRVLIPDEYLTTGQTIYAWILLHDTEDDGRHMYNVKIPVADMPNLSPEEPTPVEQSVISQAITALNSAVTTTTQKAQEASVSADRAEQAAEGAEGYAERAESAQQAAESARDRATQAETSARTSAATATEKASEAISSATTASQSAITAESASESAQESATASAESASQASQSADTASGKASDASEYASNANTSAQTASQKASEASQSASTAVQAKTDAETAKTASQTAQGLAESARDTAVSAKTDAESARDDAESARDEAQQAVASISGALAEKAPVITDTASGSIASFSDGADDLPLKSLVVDINPVQDLSHGDPSPENICPISGWTGCEVQRTGKNFCPQATIELGKPGDRTRRINVDKIPPGTYVVSYEKSGTYTGTSFGIQFYKSGTSVINVGSVRLNGTVTLTDTADYIYIYFPQTSYNNNETLIFANFQLELGSTATPYEPYTGRSITIDLGQTVYGGKLDVLTGELVVDWSEKIFSGEKSEGWYKQETYNYFNTSIISDAINANAAADDFKSNTYPYGRISNQSADLGGCLMWGSVRVRLADMSISLDDWKNMLSETPLQVCYRLAEPITIQLTPNQVNSLLGVNNLWADTGDSTVTYRADTTMYINRKIAEAISALS